MKIKYPCIYCKKSVKKNKKSILCVKCNSWAHVRCGDVPDEIFCSSEDWTCGSCLMSELPFHSEDYIIDCKSVDNESVSVYAFRKVDIDRNETVNFPTKRGMKLAHLNMRSIRNKIDELRLLLKDNPYDIFTMPETWLDVYRLPFW